jgi:hypothetical protein
LIIGHRIVVIVVRVLAAVVRRHVGAAEGVGGAKPCGLIYAFIASLVSTFIHISIAVIALIIIAAVGRIGCGMEFILTRVSPG